MARKTNMEKVLTLAAELGVQVTYGNSADVFEVELCGRDAHMALDPIGEGHTSITNEFHARTRKESRVWGMALADLHQFVPCAKDCRCYSDPVPVPVTEPATDDVDLDVAEPANVLYVAGWNTPGYLPESDPMTFNNETDAIRYLSNTVDRFWDDDYDASTTREDRGAADEKWLDVFSNLPYETAPFNIRNNDGSLTFWVTVVPKSDLPYTSEGN